MRRSALYVQGRGALRRELTACLRTGRALRVPRARSRRRGKSFVTPEIMISERSAEAADRAVPGHWEGDLIIGLGRSAIGTRQFRLFLFTQWLGGATLMALPFYVVAATGLGLQIGDVAILLGAQTAGSLASNAAWGRIGDHFGKLALLKAVGILRLTPPLGALVLLVLADDTGAWDPVVFVPLFFLIGALINGMTISYLGYLMEISPDDRRPAYSAYFNALASPTALLPLLGAAIVDTFSLWAVFVVALVAAGVQLRLVAMLAKREIE